MCSPPQVLGMEALSCAFLVQQSIHFLSQKVTGDQESRHFLAAPGSTLSSHLDMKAPISWLFFSNIIM